MYDDLLKEREERLRRKRRLEEFKPIEEFLDARSWPYGSESLWYDPSWQVYRYQLGFVTGGHRCATIEEISVDSTADQILAAMKAHREATIESCF